MNVSVGGRNTALAALKTALDGGFLYIYAGTMPADAGDALSGATLLCKVTESGDGSTGLTFEAPSGGTMTKETTEDWASAVITASGTAAFFRFCDSTDTPANASSTKARLQGRCGVAGSGAELILETVTLVNNGTNTTGCADFVVKTN